ncbi:Hypothetical predicted protein [Mytilus galloprovincialis]|uniref:Uncharacterized protein n=1 Tax=Mytilus galloprovincialis TaxID=29158 RepID=A0A8B6BR28_MYTGA|nr:Hypothetical predicted protein [Mytilus galloprovincialis]
MKVVLVVLIFSFIIQGMYGWQTREKKQRICEVTDDIFPKSSCSEKQELHRCICKECEFAYNIEDCNYRYKCYL